MSVEDAVSTASDSQFSLGESWVHLDDDREKSGFQADTRVEGLYSDHDGSGVEDMLAEAARDSDLDGEAAAMHNRHSAAGAPQDSQTLGEGDAREEPVSYGLVSSSSLSSGIHHRISSPTRHAESSERSPGRPSDSGTEEEGFLLYRIVSGGVASFVRMVNSHPTLLLAAATVLTISVCLWRSRGIFVTSI